MRCRRANYFRYGSQLAPGAPQRRDPLGWETKLAIANYLADSPKLSISASTEFENFSKAGDVIARASDFGRTPLLGAFQRSIHLADLIRKLGKDIPFDLLTIDGGCLAALTGAELERGAEAIVLKRSARSLTGMLGTEDVAKSRCYCVVFAIRTSGPLQMQCTLSLFGHGPGQVPEKLVEIPSAGFYCGLLDLARDPVRASQFQITFGNAYGDVEIFDLFAVAYG